MQSLPVLEERLQFPFAQVLNGKIQFSIDGKMSFNPGRIVCTCFIDCWLITDLNSAGRRSNRVKLTAPQT